MSEGWRIVVVCNAACSVVLAVYVQVALTAIGRLEKSVKK